MEIELRRTFPSDAAFVELINLLDQELWDRIHGRQAVYVSHNILAAETRTLVATINGKPVACGAFRNFDDKSAEIKRMFVRKDYRGRGISKIILNGLEQWAKEEGFIKTILETGFDLPEAVSLYRKSGYQISENFGSYKDLPNSVCMCKTL